MDVGKLDRGEFDFASAPPQGGAEDNVPGDSLGVSDLSNGWRAFRLLADREEKLSARICADESQGVCRCDAIGTPGETGWMSSGYGKRTDPFNGKKSYHRGVDFAGKRGSDVVAVASGVVVRAEKASGYGNLVEIRHVDGYTTLYGHNKENLVRAGDVVSRARRSRCSKHRALERSACAFRGTPRRQDSRPPTLCPLQAGRAL